MQKFTAEQKIVTIGNVTIGGQPGEYPTVLIGSMFFQGHRIVQDPHRGTFDKPMAKRLLREEGECSQQTGNPRIVDIIGQTTEAMQRYVDFVATYADCPFLVDSPSPQVRLESMEFVARQGLLDRAIYNSIEENYTEEEIARLREVGAKSAVLLAFSTRAFRPKDRMKLLAGTDGKEGMLAAAKRAGLENLLIDLGVLDVPSTAWATQSIWDAKEQFGHPAGCAPSNALYLWKKSKGLRSPAFESAGSCVFGLPVALGADFILYGSTINAKWVYPAIATMDAMVAYAAQNLGIRPKQETHPLFKIF